MSLTIRTINKIDKLLSFIELKGTPAWCPNKYNFLSMILDCDSEAELNTAFGFANTDRANAYLREFLPILPEDQTNYYNWFNTLITKGQPTSGVYILKFTNTNKIYIGKSFDIEVRYKTHLMSIYAESCAVNMFAAYKENGAVPVLYKTYQCHPHWAELVEAAALDMPDSYWGSNTIVINKFKPSSLLKDCPDFPTILKHIHKLNKSPFSLIC